MLELLIVFSVMGVSLGAAAVYVASMNRPLEDGLQQTQGMLRQARSIAMATTSAYRIKPTDDRHLVAEKGPSCGTDQWVVDDDLKLELPRGVSLTNVGWSVCFSSRGTSNASIAIPLSHSERGLGEIRVMRGGTARIHRSRPSDPADGGGTY